VETIRGSKQQTEIASPDNARPYSKVDMARRACRRQRRSCTLKVQSLEASPHNSDVSSRDFSAPNNTWYSLVYKLIRMSISI